MLIYEKIEEYIYVTEVIYGFNGTRTDIHKTDYTRMPESHAKEVKKIESGMVYATGDTSMVGGGHQRREVYSHILNGPYVEPEENT